MPATPRGRVAPATHDLELHRLALQEQTHATCRPLAVQVVIWLFRAYNAANSAHTQSLRPHGLSPSAFNVLMALHNTSPSVLEPYELAERLLVTKPSVTGLLDTLERKRLVRRRPHPRDGRRVLVELTDAGRELLDASFADHYAVLNELVAELSEDEQAQLVGLLRRIPGATPENLGGSC